MDADRYAGLLRNQARLVAEGPGIEHALAHAGCRTHAYAVAAADDAGAPSARLQFFGGGEQEGGLAGSSYIQVTDNNDRQRTSIGLFPAALIGKAFCSDRALGDPGQRTKQAGHDAMVLPLAMQPVRKVDSLR